MSRSPVPRHTRSTPHGDTADNAVTPGQIPARSWRLLLRRAARHVVVARLPLLSAGIAFFAVLSIAPVLVTALSVYGAINTPAQALDQLSRVAEMLPTEVQPIVADQLTSITTASTRVLTVRGLAGLVIALWTATTAMVSLIDVLTVAYHETETRGFLRRTSWPSPSSSAAPCCSGPSSPSRGWPPGPCAERRRWCAPSHPCWSGWHWRS